ncbi:hypothetical protein [Corynebacterium halotolerans]|uniref:hypothetical protein n=1 Tax=Corynebacterium halotolerans TaxID=225326 RepID=UPI003CF3FCAD
MSSNQIPQSPLLPAAMRWASIIAIIQSAVGIGYAILLIVRNLMGVEDQSVVTTQENMNFVGIGTAVFFILIFGTVLAGAISILAGRRWGRGPVTILQMLLLPIAIMMIQGGAWLLAIATIVSAVLALLMIFNQRSAEWAAARYGA